MKSLANAPQLPIPATGLSGWARNVIRRYPLISYSGLVMLVGFVLTLILMQVDHRMVLGINVWVKPSKFLLATGIYFLTLAWIFTQLDSWRPRRMRRLSRVLAMVLNVEVALIVMQGARGVQSHFNQATPFDAIVYAMMGILILSSTIIMAYLTWIAWSKPMKTSQAMKWAIRLGLLLFMLSSLEGGLMVRDMSHTVGAADGGAGISFLNWSTEGGDLRIAHFAGMHGLQLFPLMVLAFAKLGWNQTRSIWIFGIAYSLLSIGIFVWALLGHPMF